MLGRLFLLFSLTTAVELWLLVQIGRWMGVWPTLGLIVLTGFVGAALAKREGLRTLGRVRDDLARGAIPGDALLDGLCIIVAGALLLSPGVITDAIGFVLLVPALRGPLKTGIRRRFERAVRDGAANARFTWVSMGPRGASVVDATTRPADTAPRSNGPATDRVVLRPRVERTFRSGEVIDVTPD